MLQASTMFSAAIVFIASLHFDSTKAFILAIVLFCVALVFQLVEGENDYELD